MNNMHDENIATLTAVVSIIEMIIPTFMER